MQRRNNEPRFSPHDCHAWPVVTALVATAVLAMLAPFAPAQSPAEEVPTPSEEQKLLAVLKSDAALFQKAKACQRLAVVGGKDAVPVLSKLLGDKSLSHYARFGLEPNPDPAVDVALREAMAKLKGDLLIGVINSIGARRDAAALDSLTALLRDSARPRGAGAAAAAALGRIGTPKAARVLTEALVTSEGGLRVAIAAACLPCAELLLTTGERKLAVRTYQAVRRAKKVPRHVRMAALRGILLARGAEGLPLLLKTLRGRNEPAFNTALIAVREVSGGGVTREITATLAELPPARQAKLIGVLGERGDRAALPAVIKAARSEEPALRLASIRTLQRLGDASAVPVLIELAVHPDKETAKLAQSALARLPGKEIDAALLARLSQGGEGKHLPALLGAAGARGLRAALPMLRQAATDTDMAIRLAAIGALGQTVTLDELPTLTAALSRAEAPQEIAAVLDALKSAAARMPNREACTAKLRAAMAGATADEKSVLLEVFIAVGGAGALEAVAASARDANAGIRAAATRVLGNWQSEKAAYTLLEIVKSSDDSAERLRALHAFSALVRRLGFPKAERLAVCEQAMQLSRDDEERRVVLHTLAGIPAPETLALIAKHLSSPALVEAASEAAITISERIVRSRRGAVARAMKEVLKATKNKETAGRAAKLLRQAERKR